MAKGIEIHLAPSVVGHIGDFAITNTLVTTVAVSVLLIGAAFLATRNLKLVPSGFQTMLELIIWVPYTFIRDTIQNEPIVRRAFPIILTLFFGILAVNWFGLLPFVSAVGFESTVGHGEGGHGFTPLFYPGATDLNYTLALAFIAVALIEVLGIAALGALAYGKKFLNLSSPIAFAVGIIELISELARVVTFSFRLFGNIFAGKVLLLVLMFFVPLFVPVPLLAFEFFVGFIQAAVFAVLTVFFVKLATEQHGDDHSKEAIPHPAHS